MLLVPPVWLSRTPNDGHLHCIWRFLGCKHCHCWVRLRGKLGLQVPLLLLVLSNYHVPLQLEGESYGSHCCCCCCLHACGHGCCSRTLQLNVLFPLLLLSSLGSWLSHHGEGSVLWAPPLLFPQSRLLCVFWSIHLQVYGDVDLCGVLVGGTEEPLLRCRCFYWL